MSFEREVAGLEEDLANVDRMIKSQVDQWKNGTTFDGRPITAEVLYECYDETGKSTLQDLMSTKAKLKLALATYHNLQASEYRDELASEVARYCGHMNPSPAYPYACTKIVGHDTSEDPMLRRHGYAGIFWS